MCYKFMRIIIQQRRTVATAEDAMRKQKVICFHFHTAAHSVVGAGFIPVIILVRATPRRHSTEGETPRNYLSAFC